MKSYLIHFAAQEFLSFRCSEVLSLAEKYQMKYLIPQIQQITDWTKSNFVIFNFPTDYEAGQFVRESILIKDIYELWSTASSISQICQKIQQLPDDLIAPYFATSSPRKFRVNVVGVNKKISLEKRVELVEELLSHHNHFTATVSLTEPEFEMGFLLDYAYDCSLGRVVDDKLIGVYYGRLIASSHRNVIRQKYSLKERKFLGNTSMDVCLSFLMTNLAGVKKNAIVFDPFVGTGSLLLAAAHAGGRCFGMDIDFKLMHGIGRSPRATVTMRAPDENVLANFIQYELQDQLIGCLVGDANMINLLQDQRKPWIDFIITDPPYGVREASRKVTKKQLDVARPVDAPHFPMKESCGIEETYTNLLKLSARVLRLHGRLLFWFPIVRAAYSGDHCLPSHPAFRLLHNCEQILNTRTSRHLLVMEKHCDYESWMNDKAQLISDEPLNKVPRQQQHWFRKEYFTSHSPTAPLQTD